MNGWRLIHTAGVPAWVAMEHVVAVTVEDEAVVVVLAGGQVLPMTAEDRSRVVSGGAHVNPCADLDRVVAYLAGGRVHPL